MHRIYCQIPTRRPFIRKKISEILIRHVYEEDVVGVDELLQLYGCIAGGLSVPLNDEHKVFLEKVGTICFYVRTILHSLHGNNICLEYTSMSPNVHRLLIS